ncbi:hypothetical protein [Humibacter soli]
MTHEDKTRGNERLELRNDGVVETPTWFGPNDRPLFGWFVLPAEGAVRGAVVLCQPMGEEGDKTYRTFRRLSQKLARAGLIALRFDYDGTGDSAGRFDDPDRVSAWITSIEHAVSEVRRAGVDHVSVVGMRLGATIAYAAAARGLDLEDLVLWDPCVSGRAFLREQQLLHASWLDVDQADPERWIETPSYRYPVAAAAEIRALAIDGRVVPSALAKRVTVLVRPDRAPARGLEQALPTEEVVRGDTIGQDLLLDRRTLDAIVPDDGIADLVSRLTSHLPEESVIPQPEQTLSASWPESGSVITETARLVGPEGRLFAMETHGAVNDSALPRVLMVNVAAERHIGSGRIWVRLSREIAAEGFLSLRVDQSGVGDSATADGGHDDELLSERWMEDVPAVVRGLSSQAGVIGLGLCSSGVSVLEASLSGTVREAICVNVPLRVTQASYITTMSRKWTAFSHMPTVLNRLSIRHARTARMLWDAWDMIVPQSSPLWVPRRIVRGGSRLTFLMGVGERDEIVETRAWSALWGRPLSDPRRFRSVALPSADHSLRAGKGQDEAISAIRGRLDEYRADAIAS